MTQEVEKRNDWIYILDFSIQLGKERCLLILGVTRQSLTKSGYELKHQQVAVLDIFVREHFDGEAVSQRINSVKNKTGTPYQIISDGGHDVKKGIDIFCNDNDQVIKSYDVTHMIGVCIKHSLQNNPQWISLQEDLLSLTQQVKQSDLSFLRPIALSKKARWLNIKQEIEWLENIFTYEQRADFSLICKGYKINNSGEVFEKNKKYCANKYEEKHLRHDLNDSIFENKEDVSILLKKYNLPRDQNIGFIDAGKARFIEKFSILDKHKQFYYELKQLNQMAESIKYIIKSKGLSIETLKEIKHENGNLNCDWVKQVLFDIENRLKIEQAKCRFDKAPLLCCSDIIESIFGKFKMKANQPVGGIYSTVLSIALFCSNITEKLVRETLSKVKMSDVEKWFREMAGVSNLAKRRLAFA